MKVKICERVLCVITFTCKRFLTFQRLNLKLIKNFKVRGSEVLSLGSWSPGSWGPDSRVLGRGSWVLSLDYGCYQLFNFPCFRNSLWRCSVRKCVLRNFAKFAGKHLLQSIFFNKVAGCADCFWFFSGLLLMKVSCLFHFNRKMK